MTVDPLVPKVVNSSPTTTGYPNLWRYHHFEITPSGGDGYQEQMITGVVDISGVRGDPSGDYGVGLEFHFNDTSDTRHFQGNFRVCWDTANNRYCVRQTVTHMTGPTSDTENIYLPSECDYLFFGVLIYRELLTNGMTMVISPSFQLVYDSLTHVNISANRVNANAIDEVVVKGYCLVSDTGMNLIADAPILRDQNGGSSPTDLGVWYDHPLRRDEYTWEYKDPDIAWEDTSWPFLHRMMYGYSFPATKIAGTIEYEAIDINDKLGDPTAAADCQSLKLFPRIKCIVVEILKLINSDTGVTWIDDVLNIVGAGTGIAWITKIATLVSDLESLIADLVTTPKNWIRKVIGSVFSSLTVDNPLNIDTLADLIMYLFEKIIAEPIKNHFNPTKLFDIDGV